jgi:hypothetical protein
MLNGPAKRTALDLIKFMKDSDFTQVPHYKEDGSLYQRVMAYRNDPEFQATVKEYPQAWARIEPLLTRKSLSPARRTALDMREFIIRSRYTRTPREEDHSPLFQQFRKYRNDPELQADLKKDPKVWALVEPLLDAKVFNPARKAALDLLEFVRPLEFTKLPHQIEDSALYQRLMKYRNDPEFESALKDHPEDWARIQPLLHPEGINPARQAALDSLVYFIRTDFTKTPPVKEDQGLYKRFKKYQDDPEFQRTLKEFPEHWVRIEPLLIAKATSPAIKFASDLIEFMRDTKFTRLPNYKTENALYSKFFKYRNDREFQAELRKHPEAWKVFEREYLHAK